MAASRKKIKFKNPENTKEQIKEVVDTIIKVTNIETAYLSFKEECFEEIKERAEDFLNFFSSFKEKNLTILQEKESIYILRTRMGSVRHLFDSRICQIENLNHTRKVDNNDEIPFADSFEDLLVLARDHFCIFSINPTILGNSYTGASISILTDTIILSNKCKRGEEKFKPFDINLGSFIIHIIYEEEENSSLLVIEATNPVFSKGSESYPHPNICNDDLCLGASYAEVNHFLKTGQFLNAFDIINAIIHEYGVDNPYVFLEAWLEGYQRCRDCGEDNIDSDKSFYECCGRDWCEDCSYTCNSCDEVVCQRCSISCHHCTDRVCNKCLVRCSYCGYLFCKECATSCKNCGIYYCKNCIKTCPESNDNFCHTCFIEHEEHKGKKHVEKKKDEESDA